MDINQLFNGLTDQQKKELKEAKTKEELDSLVSSAGMELSEDQLSSVSGGCFFCAGSVVVRNIIKDVPVGAGFQLIEAMDRGAIGAMPGCSMYDVYLDIYNHYVSGDRKGAIELHNKILPMLNHIRQNVEQIISFEKRILKLRGVISCDYCRKPSYDSDPYFDKLFDEFYAEMSARYHW